MEAQPEKTMANNENANFEVLYSREIEKKNDKGFVSGFVRVQTLKPKNGGHKFVSIFEHRKPFFSKLKPENNKPAKNVAVTFDPSNKEYREALSEAFKS